MPFFIIGSCSQARSLGEKTVLIKTTSETPFSHKFSNSQPWKRSFYIFLFCLLVLLVLIHPWQKAPSPETFHFLFWLSLLPRRLHSLPVASTVLRIQASQFEAQIVLFSMAFCSSYQNDALNLFQIRLEHRLPSNKPSPHCPSSYYPFPPPFGLFSPHDRH